MKIAITAGILSASILLGGCGKKNVAAEPASSANTSVTAPAAASNAASSAAVAAPALAAWKQGDKQTAINDFLAADWTAHSIFPSDSALSLTEEQFKALPREQQEAKGREMSDTLNALREMARAVLQAGHDASAKGDAAQARKYLEALKACGKSLDRQENLVMLIRLGQSFQRDADRDLARLK